MSRSDLLELMIEQGKELEEVKHQLEEARKELSERKMNLENAGSIAEASLAVNRVFEAAQAAAAAAVEQIRERITSVISTEDEENTADHSAAEREAAKKIIPSRSNKETPDYILDPDRAMPETVIDGYTYIGHLELPALGLDIPVQSEWSYPNLRVSACRYYGSAYKNNMVICGHNYFPIFGLLTDVGAGDEVRFTDMDGNVFRYEVAGVEIHPPEAVEEMISSGCDLYDYLNETSPESRDAYFGEYMSQYSWSEGTNSNLFFIFRSEKRK